jgi:hypothetical protein
MPEPVRRALAGFEEEAETKDGEQVGVTRKVRWWNKVEALDKLARHLGLYQDKLDVTSGGQVIKVYGFNPFAKPPPVPATKP